LKTFFYQFTLIIGNISLRYFDIYVRFSIVNSLSAIEADWISSGFDNAFIHKCTQFWRVSWWWPSQLLYCPTQNKQKKNIYLSNSNIQISIVLPRTISVALIIELLQKLSLGKSEKIRGRISFSSNGTYSEPAPTNWIIDSCL